MYCFPGRNPVNRQSASGCDNDGAVYLARLGRPMSLCDLIKWVFGTNVDIDMAFSNGLEKISGIGPECVWIGIVRKYGRACQEQASFFVQ